MTYCFSLPNKNRRLCLLTFFLSCGLLASTLNNVSATVTTLPLEEDFFFGGPPCQIRVDGPCAQVSTHLQENLKFFILILKALNSGFL